MQWLQKTNIDSPSSKPQNSRDLNTVTVTQLLLLPVVLLELSCESEQTFQAAHRQYSFFIEHSAAHTLNAHMP